MKKGTRIALILIALICFGVALYYPVSEYFQKKQNEEEMDTLAALRDAGLKNAVATTVPADVETPEAEPEQTDAPAAETESLDAVETSAPAETAEAKTTAAASAETGVPEAETAAPAAGDDHDAQATEAAVTSTPATAAGEQTEPAATDDQQPAADEKTAEETPMPTLTPTPSPSPSPTPDRYAFTGAKPWPQVEKVAFDAEKVLPQYRELYAMNNDMVGWLTVSATKIDYPVMQSADDTYYLSHDFFRKDNANGLLILDSHCDPFTPSYNLVISGHNRKNNTMFSDLYEYYRDKRHWEAHKTIQFDSLMEERTYVVFAAFFAADYDEDEEGFRYNADIQYNVDMNQWLSEVDNYRLYETGIDVAFGDEVLTLTTCNSSKRKNGRFVVVCRRLRDGEVIE